MKYAILAARILLGLAFVIFGANILLHFIPMPAQPPSDAVTWSTIMAAHKWMSFIGVCQLAGGILLLVGRFVPLALTILGTVLVNILLFHLTLAGGHGIAPGLILSLLWLFLFFVYRAAFRGIFAASSPVEA